MPTPLPTHLPSLTPRESILDTLYRLLSNIDTFSPTQIHTSFSPSGVLILPELTPGVPRPPITGIEAFISSLENGIGGRMDTLHELGNARVLIDEDGETAKIDARGVAHHYRKGEGMDPAKTGFRVGTRYWVDVRREERENGGGDGWLVERLELGILWTEGDVGVLEVMGEGGEA